MHFITRKRLICQDNVIIVHDNMGNGKSKLYLACDILSQVIKWVITEKIHTPTTEGTVF